MKIDKEYPATHSMSTAWYIVDDEGNVGIMDFDDNGPVPYGIGENNTEDLAIGLHDDYDNIHEACVCLTDEQIDDFLIGPKELDGYDWSMWQIVGIDIEKKNEFFELMGGNDIRVMFCVSENKGIYMIETIDSFCKRGKDDNIIKKRSSLRKLIDQGIIISVYEMPDCYVAESLIDGKAVFEKEFEELPYYVYKQYYSTNFLQERIHIPKHPVKISQFNESIKSRIIHIPVKFKDQEKIQIAEYKPSAALVALTSKCAIVEGIEYSLLPLTNGTMS